MATSSDREDFIRSMEQDHPELLLRTFGNIKGYAEYRFQPVKELFISPFAETSWVVPQIMLDWVQANLSGTLLRPISLVLVGATRTGKSHWARALGRHVYFQTWINFDEWDNDAKFVVIDDIKWECLEKSTYKKALIGSQKDFQANVKCKAVRKIKGGIPCIYVANEMPYLDSWDRGNTVVVDIGATPLFN
jgi:Geminivirus rep protein central domain